MFERATHIHRPPRPHWAALTLAGLSGYVLGSGPIIAGAFWLQEATGWDGFYGVLWLYYPVHLIEQTVVGELWKDYIGWWGGLFGVMGPG